MKFKSLDSNIYDFEKSLGKLTFVSLRTESLGEDEDGNLTEVTKRVYNLLSEKQRKIVKVSLPAGVEEKNINITI